MNNSHSHSRKEKNYKATLFLNRIRDQILDDFPACQIVKYESVNRLVIPRNNNDVYLVDFSTRVDDGFRMGFVVDFALENSERRLNFKQRLDAKHEDIIEALGTRIVERVREENLVFQGLTTWVKNSAHRRMGLHKFRRFPSIDWSSEQVVREASREVYNFINGLESLLQRYKP